MDGLVELGDRLEELRRRMCEAYRQSPSLCDPRLVALSRELDGLVLAYLRAHEGAPG